MYVDQDHLRRNTQLQKMKIKLRKMFKIENK